MILYGNCGKWSYPLTQDQVDSLSERCNKSFLGNLYKVGDKVGLPMILNDENQPTIVGITKNEEAEFLSKYTLTDFYKYKRNN